MEDEPEEKTKCQYCITGCKQLLTFFLSHIGLLTLVVGYCLIGAVMFEALEAQNERDVRKPLIIYLANLIDLQKTDTDRFIRFTSGLFFFTKIVDQGKNGWKTGTSIPGPLDNDPKDRHNYTRTVG